MLFGNKTHVMGILNVTPDSFSGDGILSSGDDLEKIINKKLRIFISNNVDIIDIGGESTRPASIYKDSKPIDQIEEISRIKPVINIISKKTDIPISIDTMKSNVAEIACEMGATIINDVSMLSDSNMVNVARKYKTYLIISHIRNQKHINVVKEVNSDLKKMTQYAEENGISKDKIVVDPGIGFKKNSEESIEILRNIRFIKEELGYPILLGVSRKSFISSILPSDDTIRLEGTAATISYLITQGVDILRIHDIEFMTKVIKLTDSLVKGNYNSL